VEEDVAGTFAEDSGRKKSGDGVVVLALFDGFVK
jgi:hypothetical protein